MTSLQLMTDRRFWPLFWTQFLGAFNDNFFKNALVLLITVKSISIWGIEPEKMVQLLGGIFILPFFLFSATAGQIADRFEKSSLIRKIKLLEILIMILAALGFFLEYFPLLVVALFLMGFQSSIFGPIKYGVIPQLIEEEELVQGNALIETATLLAILLGTIGGGILIGNSGEGRHWVALGVLLFALLGYLSCLKHPAVAVTAPSLKINFNFLSTTLEIVKISQKNRSVWNSILGISWFWFFGAAVLGSFPHYSQETLGGDTSIITLFLALFSIGVGIGSMLCAWLSDHKLELGLVPIGAFGISLFAADLFFAGRPVDFLPGTVIGLSHLLEATWGQRIIVDLLLISVFSGFFIVPLYTLIQQRASDAERSRVIAANNIVNAAFMVVAALMVSLLLSKELTYPQIFLVLALMNAAVAIYIFQLVPEFLFRFVCYLIASVMYRVKAKGLAHIPKEGACVLVCNHVTFVDWLIIAAMVRRPPRFVMHYKFYFLPVVRRIFSASKCIPIAGVKEDPGLLDQAFDRIAAELDNGEVVCIFPEGRLPVEGRMDAFRSGIEKIIARNPVPVVPMALEGLWGSFFSKKWGTRLLKRPRRFWSRVELRIGQAIPASQVSARLLEEKVVGLLGGKEY